MGKKKRLAHYAPTRDDRVFSPESLLQRGWNAFQAGQLGQAIDLWERALKKHPEAAHALAEAYFRRGVSPTSSPVRQLADLQRAAALRPGDACYTYHLGLARHRRGALLAALTAYQLAFDANPQQRGLALTFALAKLEADAQAEVSDLPGLSQAERQEIRLLSQLLRRDTSFLDREPQARSWLGSLADTLGSGNPNSALWRGLGHLLVGDEAAAQQALQSSTRLSPALEALRRYYLGVLAARRGESSAALLEWQQARTRGFGAPWLIHNLAATYLPRLREAAQDGNWKGALENARAAIQAGGASVEVRELAVVALDRLGHEAARAGRWAEAAARWSEAREMQRELSPDQPAAAKLSAAARAVLQNLAIAAERSENWGQAAEAWQALLKSKPRGKKAADTFTEAQWNWMRQRATQDLQKGGRFGEAITLLRKKVKANPNDLAAYWELAEALKANGQDTAARNELKRILELEPQHREARLKLAEWHAEREEWHAAEMELAQLLEQAPADETLRKRLALLIQQRGRSLHADGRVAAARQAFVEALRHAPQNPDLYIDLGRADLDLRQRDAARQDFAEAYRVGAQQVSTHEQIVCCWILDRNLAETQAALERAERDLKPNAHFYAHVGLACLMAPTQTLSPFSVEPPRKSDGEWEKLGQQLLARALSLQPNDPELLRHIVASSIQAHSPAALPYAERLTRLTPDDPGAWITRAYLELFGDQLADSKKSLKEASRLARQQGLHEMEQMASQLRRKLDNPFLSMALRMGVNLDSLLSDLGGPDEFDDLDEDLFWVPSRRKRSRR